jgi:hypothetical protein
MKKLFGRLTLVAALAAMFAGVHTGAGAPDLKTRNVVLIISDGLRWQEIFSGADKTLINQPNGGSWVAAEVLRKNYWREDVGERRKVLFPFLWGTIARKGQIFGNQNKGSVARVTNGLDFSYPGYNEMLTGHADPHINSNEFGENPNVTVFEWLNRMPEFAGHVGVYGTWDTFKYIFNEDRSKLAMQAGWDLPAKENPTSRQEMLNELYKTTTRFDDDSTYDAFLQPPLMDYIASAAPRVLFVGYGETDDWAHAGRYDNVLQSAQQFDRYVEQLWNTMQSMAGYRDQTTFILTTDHGRGSGRSQWKEHGVGQKGSENIWIAVLGPDTLALGERANIAAVTQSQIAATVAGFLGKDYRAAMPAAAPALPDVIGGDGGR